MIIAIMAGLMIGNVWLLWGGFAAMMAIDGCCFVASLRAVLAFRKQRRANHV